MKILGIVAGPNKTDHTIILVEKTLEGAKEIGHETVLYYLTDLFLGVQKASGYSKSNMVQFMMNAFEGSWLPRSAKDYDIKQLIKYAAANGVIMS